MNENDAFFEELKRDVDADHRRIDGADGPPTHLWQTIHAQAKPEAKQEENVMNTTRTIEQSPVFAPRVDTHPQSGGRHTLSLAASFLVVVSVALGGWFAMSQLQPGSDGRFAAFGIQPEEAGNGVCDVDPISVDDAIAILHNPYSVMGISEQELSDLGHPTSYLDARNVAFEQNVTELFGTAGFRDVTSDELEGFSEVANEYLDCSVKGTVGQVFRFIDPARIQIFFQRTLPFFVSEEEARELIPPILEGSGNSIWWSESSAKILESVTPQASSDISQASMPNEPYTQFHFRYLVIMPVVFVDGQNDIVEEFASTPKSESLDRNIVLGKSYLDDEWYVLGVYEPEPEDP